MERRDNRAFPMAIVSAERQSSDSTEPTQFHPPSHTPSVLLEVVKYEKKRHKSVDVDVTLF